MSGNPIFSVEVLKIKVRDKSIEDKSIEIPQRNLLLLRVSLTASVKLTREQVVERFS